MTDPFEIAREMTRAADLAEDRRSRPMLAIIDTAVDGAVSVSVSGRAEPMTDVPSMSSTKWFAPGMTVLIMSGASPSVLGYVPWKQS